jgi:cell division protein FtsI (penicillin-binding protein 3)
MPAQFPVPFPGPPSGPRDSGGPRSGHAARPVAATQRTAPGSQRRPSRPEPLRRSSPRRRLNAALLAVAFVVSLIVGRLVQLQGMQAAHFRTLSENQNISVIPIPALRGAITSSDGTMLAMTVQTDQVAADPPDLKEDYNSLTVAAAKLAGPLRMKRSVLLRLLRHPTSPQNVVLKQSVNITTADTLANLDVFGLTLTPSYTRAYPGGDLAAGVLGFVHNNQAADLMTGEAGLEEEYNALLSGKNGSKEEEIEPNGVSIIPGTQTVIKKVVAAGSLRLSIQSDIQWEAQHACAEQVRATRAKNCSVIVIQPSTGRVLAIAQYPTFNPNGPIASLAATDDLPLSEVFAPGSTAKVITAAAAFQYAGETPRTSYVVPDAIFWHGAWYHDAEAHPTQRYTIAGIIAHSLNDGMVQVAEHVPPRRQYDEFRAFGFGAYSGLNLPGESPGLLRPYQEWTGGYRNERYQISFGQSIGVTAIQMASVYATIANGGVRVAPTIVEGHTTSTGKYIPAPRPASRRVISAKTAAQLLSALEQVPLVYNRAGEPWGMIPGYTVAAKTGTAQEPDNTYGSSFIGIAPAGTRNSLVVAVNVQDPRRGSYFGIEVAGPVFNAVMKFALATMKIPPNGGHVPYVPLTAGQER